MNNQVHCRQCKHYDHVGGLQVLGRCLMTDLRFPTLNPAGVAPDPDTFFCSFAEEKPKNYFIREEKPMKKIQAPKFKKQICTECSGIFQASAADLIRQGKTPYLAPKGEVLCPFCGAVQKALFAEVTK